MFQGIDLSSDTATQPTKAMKKAMMEAPLGDEQKGEDPTTVKLEGMVADMLGFDRALFFPSATMANELALCLLCEPGDELIAAENCHLFTSEGGGPAIHAKVMARAIPTKTGLFTGEDLRLLYRTRKGMHHPISKCVSIENTTNLGGGLAWDEAAIQSVLVVAKELHLKTHLDGARLLNAAVKLNVDPKKLTTGFDTTTLCLSKGLGCPVGAVLALSNANYVKARRLKHLFGGAMRQSGILAAAGIYALQNNVSRLAEDHRHAELFSSLLSGIPSIEVESHPFSTNMVFFKWKGTHLTPAGFYEACVRRGFRFSQVEENRFRAVFHLDIIVKELELVVDSLNEIALQN